MMYDVPRIIHGTSYTHVPGVYTLPDSSGVFMCLVYSIKFKKTDLQNDSATSFEFSSVPEIGYPTRMGGVLRRKASSQLPHFQNVVTN